MNVRETVYQVLVECIMHHGYANLLMRKALNMYDVADKKLATHLVYGVLRSYDLCLESIKPYLKKSCGKKLEILLVLGTYQLLYTNIPSYSAINETVALAKKQERGFINAILRNVSKNGEVDLSSIDEFEQARIKASIPSWIANLWKAQYGYDKALLFLNAASQPALVFGRFNTLKIDPSTINDEKVTLLDDSSFSYEGNIQESNYYHLGQAVVQDYNSAQIVKWLDCANVNNVLDGCAAPGSKTSQLAMMMSNKGCIEAIELHPHRCQLLEDNMQRLGISNVNVKCSSLLDAPLQTNYYDAILLDVPCSGLGVLARRAEIRYHITSETLDQLQVLQAQLLDHVCDSLKENGQLLYSTCTLNVKENEKQIAAFILRHPNFELIKEETMLPNNLDGDSFYRALLIKKSN